MINHARTLLANLPGDGAGQYPGSEFIPTGFRPVVNLPSAVVRLRRIFFGGDSPDRGMIHYRVAQLMLLVHSTRLAEYVVRLDPRVTYRITSVPLWDSSMFQLVVTPSEGTSGQLFVVDPTQPGEQESVLFHRWQVVVDAGEATITRTTPPPGSATASLAYADGLSSLFQFPGSSMQGRVTATTGRWTVQGNVPPSRSLADILAAIDHAGEPALLSLFGIGSAQGAQEPWLTLYNCYKTHHELPYRLGAVVMSVVLRTELARLGATT